MFLPLLLWAAVLKLQDSCVGYLCGSNKTKNTVKGTTVHFLNNTTVKTTLWFYSISYNPIVSLFLE